MNKYIKRFIPLAALLFTVGIGCNNSETNTEKDVEAVEKAEDNGEGDSADPITVAINKGLAVPQDQLRDSADAILISGTIVVDGYVEGLIQIDAQKDKQGPQRPVTTERFDQPGPFKMYVPSNVGRLVLSAILDIKKDGPGHEDPKGKAEDGPIRPSNVPMTGINISIDMTNTQEPPPSNQPPQPSDGDDKTLEIDDSEDSEIILKADSK